jgi:hypothetical protein
MMDFLINVGTSFPALIGLGIGGPALWVCCALGLVRNPLLKLLAVLLIADAIFVIGFRAADDRAAQKAALDRKDSQIASLQSERDRLNFQLARQAQIATTASNARAELAEHQAARDALIARYEKDLADAKAKPASGCDDVIDDADLRLFRSLQQRPKSN